MIAAMPTVSIITAVHAPSAGFLDDTASSVAGQILPQGWDLEWVVQEDGDTPALADYFASVPYARFGANGRQLGVPGTRNLALDRAKGGLVRVLDADDVLLPDALASLIPHFERANIHWAVGQADDLMTDGSRVPWEPLIPTGLVQAGAVNDWAIEHGGNWPIHGAGLTMRTDTLRAFGGWAGTPNDEDLVMFAALSEACDGYNDPGITWLYRQHPGQVTRTAAVRKLSEASRRIALSRVQAVRALGMRLDVQSLPPLDAVPGAEITVGPAQKDRDSDEYL